MKSLIKMYSLRYTKKGTLHKQDRQKLWYSYYQSYQSAMDSYWFCYGLRHQEGEPGNVPLGYADSWLVKAEFYKSIAKQIENDFKLNGMGGDQ